ncbi:MAG: carbon-nitrogen family hydrolase [Chloroflexi bacterium]|jgi:omega-amidase|nr:carbon-nitrogen family hydrolase [Chloroflexota bacterium]MBT7081178.1 carbon-nitrogen family hydrolase [Chloroflexota bacterium]MBT7290844.1 carbon-nitrogen family hydrolase [Chloroflexota bacterium]
MRIGLIQIDTAWHDKEQNYQKAEELIRKAAYAGCDIAVLPEMFNTGYSMAVEEIGEALDGPTSAFLQKVAIERHIGIIAGYPAFDNGSKGLNVARAIDSGGSIVATYIKLYPFTYAGEHLHYKAGNSTVIFDIGSMSASVFICYDLRFPEAFRDVASAVQCIFVIGNWPASRIDHWSTMLKARAIENQCFVVGVNRIGTDGNGVEYNGNSHVFSPTGEQSCCGTAQDELLTVDIDPTQVDKHRREFPFLDDMRD